MKKHLVLLALILGMAATAQTQHRFTIGWVTGAGTNVAKSDLYYNTAQFSMSAGVDMGFRLWRMVSLTGRAEYQKRVYLLNPTTVFITADPYVLKDAIHYRAGLLLRDKNFYASFGPTFSDNLNAPEQRQLFYCGVGLTDEDLERLSKPQYEYFNTWGWYASVGCQRPLTPRANVLIELGYTKETTDIMSAQIDPFRQLNLRLGAQFLINNGE